MVDRTLRVRGHGTRRVPATLAAKVHWPRKRGYLMAVITAPPVMTTEELLALPQDGVERWLIRGQLRKRPMTIRNRWHSRIMTRMAKFLDNWLDLVPEPRGLILCGEAGCRLRRNPDTTVGIDVVYVSAE